MPARLRELSRGLASAGLLLAGSAHALPAADLLPRPREESVLYRPVSGVELTDAHGRSRSLSDLWQRRPVLLTLVFANCAEICPPFLRSLEEAVTAVGGAGRDFEVVVVSCDPRDRAADMARMAERHGLAGAPGWTFAVTSPAGVERLTREIGFVRRFDPERGQYDHPALLAALDQGRVVRLLVGATVPPRRLSEVVWELRHELVPTYPLPGSRVLFRCFGYDPKTGGLTLDWGILLLLVPALAMVAGTAWIFGTVRRGTVRREG